MSDLTKARLSLNTATVNQWSLKECIEGCVRRGVPAIGPWRDKLHELGVDTAAQMIKDNGLQVSALVRGGFFTASDQAGRQAALDENRRALEEAVVIGAQCLVLVVGGLPDDSKDLPAAREQVRDGIAELLSYAQDAKIPLAIEPLHPMTAADRACVNTLEQANDLCDELGDGLGIAVDAYHVWWDPNLAREIKRAAGRILGFHICDWLVPTRDLVLDRGMMGDGVIDLPAMRQMVEDAGYTGLIEVEIFSAENWWKRDGDVVMRTAVERFESVV